MPLAIPRTFKELVQHAVRESGAATGGADLPAAVAGQVNSLGKMVARVAEAWVEIQSEHKWNFLRGDFTFNLQVGVRSYVIAGTNPGELNWQDLDELEEKGRFIMVRADTGTKQELSYLNWDKWRNLYGLTADAEWAPQAPTLFTIDTSGHLLFNAKSDMAHALTLPYWKQPQELAADADEPIIDAKLRRVISWRAVRKFADDKSDFNRSDHAKMEESALYHALMRKYLPPIVCDPQPII